MSWEEYLWKTPLGMAYEFQHAAFLQMALTTQWPEEVEQEKQEAAERMARIRARRRNN